MTMSEFERRRNTEPCQSCGHAGLVTQHNPNNNGLLIHCPNCGSKRPWGALLYLKQNEKQRVRRPSLPEGQTLDSIWERYGDRCVMCSAPKAALAELGIGRQIHHVAPYAQEGHKGPLVPICTHCHPVVNERQRIYWFIQNIVMQSRREGVAVHENESVELPVGNGHRL